MSHLVPHERFFKKQTTFFCCFPLTKELSKFLKRIVLGNRHFGTLSLNALIIKGAINNDGLCIGARFWPQKVNSQMSRVELSSVLFFFRRVIIGIVLAFIVAIAGLYFMARVEI